MFKIFGILKGFLCEYHPRFGIGELRWSEVKSQTFYFFERFNQFLQLSSARMWLKILAAVRRKWRAIHLKPNVQQIQ